MDDQSAPRGALSGRVAVVVGGASGIGRAAAKALARQGARLVIADFDTARMERTVEDAIKAMGQVDVLVNMAGVLLQGKLEKLKSSDWRWMLETNLLGPVRTVAAVLPHMLARRSGHIVNAVSAGGLAPTDPLTVA